MTLYADLGLEPDATPDEIRAAHLAGVKRTHPDKGGDPEEFAKVQHAALVLRDPAKRERYDRTGDTGDQPNNSLAELTQILASAFDRAMQQDGWHYRDIIGQMKNILEQDKAEQQRNRTPAKDAKAAAQKALKMLKFKGQGRNLIASVLEQRIQLADQAIAAMNARVAMLEKAIEAARDYDWEADKRPERDFGEFTIEEMIRRNQARMMGTTTTGW